MSARAAWRLETLGFQEVYRYTDGKADWLAHGLPSEGKVVTSTRLADLVRVDVPTCGIETPIGTLRDVVGSYRLHRCAVVTRERVVLGLLRPGDLAADDGVSAGDVMVPGPTTMRPNGDPVAAVAAMDRVHDDVLLVTTSDGVLVGLVTREDAERAAPG